MEVEQLRVSHTADDDNVWFFRLPGDPDDVQVDTHPDGRPPFLVESSQSAERANVAEAADAARIVLTWLTSD